MASDSSAFSDQFANSDDLNDSELQPRIVGGNLQLYDSSDSSGYINPAFVESSTDPDPEVQHEFVTSDENRNVLTAANGHAPIVNGHASLHGNSSSLNRNSGGVRLPPPPSKKDIINQKQEVVATIPHTDTTSLPVVYDNRSGNNVVIPEQVVITQSDGSREIQTRAIPERGREMTRPLRKKTLKLLKIFSIIAIVFFFPTGIPACFYAFKAKTEFEEGILRGNIDKAVKYSKRSERLIILSGVLALVVGILCFAMVERSMHPERYVNWHPSGLVGHQ